MVKPKIKLHITKKQLIAIGGVVALLLAMMGAGFLVWWLQNREQLSAPYDETTERPVPAVVAEAQDLSVAGNVEESNKKLDEAIKQLQSSSGEGNKEEKQKVYVQRGVNHSNSGEYAQALQLYLEAEKVSPTFTTAQLVGETYEALGDKPKAVEYLKIAVSRLDPESTGYFMDRDYYQGKIRELGGQP